MNMGSMMLIIKNHWKQDCIDIYIDIHRYIYRYVFTFCFTTYWQCLNTVIQNSLEYTHIANQSVNEAVILIFQVILVSHVIQYPDIYDLFYFLG